MGSTRSLFRATGAQGQEWVQEWVDAELVEHVELLEVRVASLETERVALETALTVAQRRVRELGLWLDEAQVRAERYALPAMADDYLAGISPRAVRLLQEVETAPIAWGRLAVLAGFILGLWAVIGSLVYLTWLLVS